MKKLGTVIAALAVGFTATACITPTQGQDSVGRITYTIETFTVAGTTETSVLLPIKTVVGITRIATHGINVRDGRSGAWLVLPWESTEGMTTPVRYQFTYDTRNTEADDFLLQVKASVTTSPGTHLRCLLSDTFESPTGTRDEAIVDATGVAVVSCLSKT
jgi:hypothetical protein